MRKDNVFVRPVTDQFLRSICQGLLHLHCVALAQGASLYILNLPGDGLGLGVSGCYCSKSIWRLFSVTFFPQWQSFLSSDQSGLSKSGTGGVLCFGGLCCFFFLPCRDQRLWINFPWHAACSPLRWSCSGLNETSILSLWGPLRANDKSQMVVLAKTRPHFLFCFEGGVCFCRSGGRKRCPAWEDPFLLSAFKPDASSV